MLHLTKGTAIPTVEQTLSILRGYQQIKPIYLDMDMLLMMHYKLKIKLTEYSKQLTALILRREDLCATPVRLINGMIADTKIEQYFNKTATGQLSLDKVSISNALDALQQLDYLPDSNLGLQEVINALQLYQAYNVLEKIQQAVGPLLNNKISDLRSFDGHRMLEVVPKWSAQNTGRLGMAEPAIQNLPHMIQSVVTAPEGYKLIHTDSGQVEPRITYSCYVRDPQIKRLIELYDDAYFGVLHYCTMPDYMISSATTDLTVNEITDDMKNNREKIKTFGNAIMYGSTSNPRNDSIKEKMIERIGKNPYRIKYCNELQARIDRGEKIFYTYFGTPIDISKSPKLAGGYDSYQLLKLAINNPIQGTAADLMRYSVMEAHRLCSKVKGATIVDYVHDAGCFYVPEDSYDVIGKELEDIVAYDVEGWIKIKAEPEIREHISSNELMHFYL